ncbi:FAD:protein FMN transferase [Actinomadura sp. DC4]|uniref:FAD:protein FMN transferase n=1 Tax=Actinomadura sp. DC4 TaxID=3055069 RepID=UPI0025B1FE97|nr:FAD:protein FMN transferase [Actinomadura sp. DC4]MDN3359791.1 FAD:protein FMN transferase [Actinomadura sp. DC4]
MTGRLLVTDARRMEIAWRVMEAEIAATGAACDRFHTGSELSRVNAAQGNTVRVSAVFAEVLGHALDAAAATGGAVDPTVGGALVSAGYDRDLAAVRSRSCGTYAAPRPVAGWPVVELRGRTVRVPRGVTLDLGATAKAFTADRAASRAASAAGCGVLVGLGGDIAVSGPAPSDGWRVRVCDDHRAGPGEPGRTFTITDGGLATSSLTIRRWRRGGRWLHHIIDPATGAPAGEHWRTVSVAAASCVDANAASTAAMIKGRAAADWLTDRSLPSRLVHLDGTALTVAGWPSAESETPG